MRIPGNGRHSAAVSAAVIVAVLALLCAFYYFADPSSFRFMPKCAFHSLTGLQCPGCGSQRAIHALLHGDIAAACYYNLLLVVCLPFVALLAFAEIFRKSKTRLYARINNPVVIAIICVVIVAWGIGRNLPLF